MKPIPMPGYTGHCLCGGCTIHIEHPHATSSSYDLKHISCHCTDCQHISGTSRTTSVLPRIEDVVMVGDIHRYHSESDSGNVVTRLFCGTCGSSIGHRSNAIEGYIAIHTGNFPDFHSITLTPKPISEDPSKSKSLLLNLTPKSMPRNSPTLCPRSTQSQIPLHSLHSHSHSYSTSLPPNATQLNPNPAEWDLSSLHTASLDSPPPVPQNIVEERPIGVPKYSWELSPSYSKLDLQNVPTHEMDKDKMLTKQLEPEPEPRPTGVPLYSWELWEMSSSYEESFRLARFNRSQGVSRTDERQEKSNSETPDLREECINDGESVLGKRKDGEIETHSDDEQDDMEVKEERDIISPFKKAKMDGSSGNEVTTRIQLVEDKSLDSSCSRRNHGRRTQRWIV